MGRGELDDIVALLGIGIIGSMAYNAWYKGQPLAAVLGDIDTKLRALLDDIASKMPALPPIPSFTPPQFPLQQQPVAAAQTPPSTTPPAEPDKPERTPTNTLPETNEEPKVNKPANAPPPETSGQLPTNPNVSTPPTGSGGTIIAFAGDWESNNKSIATSQQITKQGCQLIIGVGDYSYSGEKAIDWFNKIVGKQWAGKMKGCFGNHDTHDSDGFLRTFNMTSWNSAAKVAPNLTVVFIDTQKGIDAALLDSLTSAAKSQSKHVAYVFHKPHVTSGNGHHKGSENKWGSIIDTVAKKHGVKLMIAGHNHLYEHFLCNGIHYVTSGAAGRKFYGGNCSGSCSGVKCVENTNGFLKVSVGENLLCQFISNSGQVLDSFTVTPIGVASNRRIIYPYQQQQQYRYPVQQQRQQVAYNPYAYPGQNLWPRR